MTKELHLGVLINGTGFHIAGWRHPSVNPLQSHDIDYYTHLARTAEAACFDVLFMADGAAVNYVNDPEGLRRMAPPHHLEPTTLLSAIAARTSAIGLVGTISTTYNEPYHVARRIASMDHISRGRAAWNVVTSDNIREALNFTDQPHPEHDERYARAREFLDVVLGLWDSWDDDALILNQETGIYLDPDRMRPIDHHGQYFHVQGPMNCFRPPSGHPVLAQAGSSPVGRDFGAATSDLIFTAQKSLEDAVAFRQDIRRRAQTHGRNPDHVKVLPGIVPIVGETPEEAEEKYGALQSLITPEVGLQLLRDLLGGFDLSPWDIDGPVPDIPPSNAGHARREMLVSIARERNFTIRQLYEYAAGSRGHRVLLGSAKTIADDLQHWAESEAADGFALMPPYLPLALDEFCAEVVPELQKRGLFRKAYRGTTLREHLGLERPANRVR